MTTASTLHIRADAICSGRPRRQLRQSMLLLLLVLFGYSGTLWAAIAMYQLPCHLPFFLGIAGAAFLLAVLLQSAPRFAGLCTGGVSLLLLSIPLFCTDRTLVGIQNLVNQYYRLAHRTDLDYFQIDLPLDPTMCTTLVTSAVAALLALFFVWFTMRRPLFLLSMAVIFLVLEPGLYMGIALPPIAAIPLVAYGAGMLAMRLAMARQIAAPGTQTAVRCGMYTALLTAAVYGGLVLVGTCIGYDRTEADRIRRRNLAAALGSIQLRDPDSFRAIGSLFQSQKDAEHSALGTKEQLERTTDTELVVTFDTLSKHAIYLKGFTGCTYADNQWYAAPDESVADAADQIDEIINSFQCAPQSFSFLFQQSLAPDTDLVHCTITASGRSLRQYQPYLSYSAQVRYTDDGSWQSNDDSYTWRIADPDGTTQSLLSQSPLSDVPYTLPETDEPVIDRFLDALGLTETETFCSSRFPLSQAATEPADISGKVIPGVLFESTQYRSYVQKAYGLLPEVAALDEVYEAMPQSLLLLADPETVEQQYDTLYALRDWITAQASYNTAPGRTPGTRDFIHFFLLENGQGYCMHFASAGTVLARYLGIPARYCEGYIIGTDTLDNAEKTDDGYEITLTREQSHAWCEFYIDGYGWVPFEMTPGYYQLDSADPSQAQQAPSFAVTAPAFTTTANATTTATTADDTTHTTAAMTTQTTTTQTDPPAQAATTEPDLRWLWITLGCVGSVAGLVVAEGLLRRYHLQRRRQYLTDLTQPHRAILTAYRDTLRLLQVCGAPYRGGLVLDYASALPTALEPLGLSADPPRMIIQLALASDLGNHTPTPTEQQAAAEAYYRFADAVYHALPPLRRLRLRLMHLR